MHLMHRLPRIRLFLFPLSPQLIPIYHFSRRPLVFSNVLLSRNKSVILFFRILVLANKQPFEYIPTKLPTTVFSLQADSSV